MSKVCRNNLTVNYIFNLVNRIVVLVVPIITTPYLTRVLGADELGLYNYANTIASYYVMLAMMGMSMLGNKQIALSRAKDNTDEVFSGLLSVQIFNTMICVVAYIVYILLFCKNNRLIAGIHFFYILSAIFDVTWFLQGLEQFKFIALRNIMVNIVTTACIFLFVKDGNDLVVYTIIKCFSVLISQLILAISCIKRFTWIKPSKNFIKNIYRQLFVLFIPVAAESIFHNMDRIMLGVMIDYSAVAIYYTSRMITDIPQCLVTSINTIMYPRITALYGLNQKEKADGITYFSFEIINLLCIAMAFGISAISKDFVSFYLGVDYQECANCMPWLAPYIVLAAWNGTLRYQFLLPKSMEKVYSKAIVVGIIFNLLLNVLLIKRIGVIGAILATVLSEVVTGLIQSVYAMRDMKLWLHLRNIMAYCVSGILMQIIIQYISSVVHCELVIKLMLEILCGAIVYLSTAFLGIILVDKKVRKFILSIRKD